MHQSTSQFVLRSAALGICAAAVIFLSGCAYSGPASSGSVAMPLSRGTLYGGQQPIQDAHVYLYAAGNGGYGSASSSLFTPGATGTLTDTDGNAYITTDSSGSFTYGGAYLTCNAGTPLYLLALGGNASGTTGGPDNPAIALSAAIGECGAPNPITQINEVTTVAMAYALGSFMVGPTHVGATSSNLAGLQKAFATINNLVDNTTGVALTTTPAGNGVAPLQYVNTLADIIATCVNSTTAGTACSQLFTFATPTSAAEPQDTLTALINIAAFPGAQTASLYGLVAAAPPFQPTLSTQPNDFALGITYSPTAITAVQPAAVVIDAAGNIWMANCQSCLNPTAPDSLLEFSSTGVFLNSFTGSAVPGTQVLHQIKGIALDATSSNIYTINQGIPGGPAGGIGDDQLIKLDTATGTLQAGFPIDFDQATYGVDTFNGVAVDNSGELWATALNTGAIIQATPNGNLINGSPFFIGGTVGVATDNIGNIWFAGTGGNNIVQFDTNGDFLQNYTPGGLDQPLNMAINGANELLTINNGTQTVSKVEFFNGNNGSGSPYTNLSIFQASVIAVDGSNQLLIPNCRASCPSSGSTSPDNLLRVSQSGVPDTGGGGVDYGAEISGFSGVVGAAVDNAGNVWVANSIPGTLTEVVGFAAPTIQPLALASANGQIGQLP